MKRVVGVTLALAGLFWVMQLNNPSVLSKPGASTSWLAPIRHFPDSGLPGPLRPKPLTEGPVPWVTQTGSTTEITPESYLQNREIQARAQTLIEALGDLPAPLLTVVVASDSPEKTNQMDRMASQAAMMEIRRDPQAAIAVLLEAMRRLRNAPEWESQRQLVFEVAASIASTSEEFSSDNRRVLEDMKALL